MLLTLGKRASDLHMQHTRLQLILLSPTDEIVRKLRHALRIPVLYAPIPTSTTPPTAAGTEQTVNHPDSNAEDVVTEDPVILYVGGESLGLTNLLMAHNASIVRYCIPRRCTSPHLRALPGLLVRS